MTPSSPSMRLNIEVTASDWTVINNCTVSDLIFPVYCCVSSLLVALFAYLLDLTTDVCSAHTCLPRGGVAGILFVHLGATVLEVPREREFDEKTGCCSGHLFRPPQHTHPRSSHVWAYYPVTIRALRLAHCIPNSRRFGLVTCCFITLGAYE